MKCHVAVVLSLGLISSAAAAQSRATITDSRSITEKSGSAPDTVYAHTVSSGAKHRSQSTGGKYPWAAIGVKPGSIELMTFADSEMTMDFLDPQTKTYSEFKPGGVVKGAMQMIRSIGGEMKSKFSADSSAVDSLGDGGIIAGHKTVRFRTHFVALMTMRMLGDSIRVAMQAAMDMYVAPDLKDPADSSANRKSADDVMASMKGLIPFDVTEAFGAFSVQGRRIANAGVPLKTVNSITTTAMGHTTIQRMTTEILKYERGVVPDSTFLIPPDYKKVDLKILMPGMPSDSTSKTSRALRTPF